jgi:hypothetical protein
MNAVSPATYFIALWCTLSVFFSAALPAHAVVTPPLATSVLSASGSGTIGTITSAVASCVILQAKLKSANLGVLKEYADTGGTTGAVVATVTGTTGTILSEIEDATSVPVSDAKVQKTVQDIQKASAVSAKSASTDTQKTCWRSIEKAAAQIILRMVTMETIKWINSGFNGSPMYVQDTGSFLEKIRNETIGDFTGMIAFDPEKYPFGKIVAQGIISGVSGTFERNAQYSLNQVIARRVPGATDVDFQANFGNGSWDAFGAQFEQQNNPFGFNFYARNELAVRIKDTGYSPAQDIKDQIMRSGGFLDLRTCIDPVGYDASDPKARCFQWKTETPGSVIVNQLNTTLNQPLQQLSLGDDITADMIAIIDALLNQGIKYGLSKIEQ